MIEKPRTIPLIIAEIDAILERLSNIHYIRQILEEKRKNFFTGYRGELQIDYHLKTLDMDKFIILTDLRLVYQNQTFQIDTLIISPYFVVIIESKNIAGTLIFEKNSSQVIRELEGKSQGFQNPLVQVKRQKLLLNHLLKKHNIPSIPIEDLVGIAERKTIIVTSPDNLVIFEKLVHADMLLNKINKFEAAHTQKPMEPNQIKKLVKLLLKLHTPAPPSILKTYGIAEFELIKGPQCPLCKKFPLQRQAGSWYCRSCETYSKDAHKQAIYDYFLIISLTITNKKCREFLLLDSHDVAKKLLSRMKLPVTGINRYRIYHRPKKFQTAYFTNCGKSFTNKGATCNLRHQHH